MKRRTDKALLDWANRNGDSFGQDLDGRWWAATAEKQGCPQRYRTIRQALSAAMTSAASAEKGRK